MFDLEFCCIPCRSSRGSVIFRTRHRPLTAMLQPSRLILITAFCSSFCEDTAHIRHKRQGEHPDASLWKKELEDELGKPVEPSKKKGNVTRGIHYGVLQDNEAVVERLMDTLATSEKYLKKVEAIDFRLNRLDIEVHEKTSSILKYLADIAKMIRIQSAGRLGAIVDTLQNDMGRMRNLMDQCTKINVEGQEISDGLQDSRLSVIDANVKSILSGVETIVATISEVKNRQYVKASVRSEAGGAIDSVSLLNEFRRSMYEQRMRKCDCKVLKVDRSERYPTDCHEIQMQGFNVSGIYKIRPDDMEPFYVLCDLLTAGGGWTVFQNRFDGTQDFYRGWSDYKHGFGNLAGEFWLGLDKLHYLTNQKLYELRVDMETNQGEEGYAGYSVFTVGPEHEGYRISTIGTFYGNAGDSLSYHAGQKFSTLDADKDEWKDGNCANEHGGAWWYKECDKSNLNGRYATNTDEFRGQNIYWITFKGPNVLLTKTKMMIRPLPASKPSDFYDYPKKSSSFKMKKTSEKPLKPKSKIKEKNIYDLGRGRPYFKAGTPNKAYFSTYEQ